MAIHPMQSGATFRPNKRTGKKKPNPMKEQRVVDYLDSKFLVVLLTIKVKFYLVESLVYLLTNNVKLLKRLNILAI